MNFTASPSNQHIKVFGSKKGSPLGVKGSQASRPLLRHVSSLSLPHWRENLGPMGPDRGPCLCWKTGLRLGTHLTKEPHQDDKHLEIQQPSGWIQESREPDLCRKGQGEEERAHKPPALRLLRFYRPTPSPSHCARNPAAFLGLTISRHPRLQLRRGRHNTSQQPWLEIRQIWRRTGV